MIINFCWNFNVNNLFMEFFLKVCSNLNTVGLLLLLCCSLVSFIYLLNLFNEIVYTGNTIYEHEVFICNISFIILIKATPLVQKIQLCSKPFVIDFTATRLIHYYSRLLTRLGLGKYVCSSVSVRFVYQRKQNGIYRYLCYVYFILYSELTDIFL